MQPEMFLWQANWELGAFTSALKIVARLIASISGKKIIKIGQHACNFPQPLAKVLKLFTSLVNNPSNRVLAPKIYLTLCVGQVELLVAGGCS
jgi:hypothetical protein